jgi:hypothetical protein
VSVDHHRNGDENTKRRKLTSYLHAAAGQCEREEGSSSGSRAREAAATALHPPSGPRWCHRCRRALSRDRRCGEGRPEEENVRSPPLLLDCFCSNRSRLWLLQYCGCCSGSCRLRVAFSARTHACTVHAGAGRASGRSLSQPRSVFTGGCEYENTSIIASIRWFHSFCRHTSSQSR